MHFPRSFFTPCYEAGLVYLVSGDKHKKVEVFDVERERFRVLEVELPREVETGLAVTFVVNGEMCFLNEGKQMARWNLTSESTFRLSHSAKMCWSKHIR